MSEELIAQDFEEAVRNREVTDVLGNPMQEEIMDELHNDVFHPEEWIKNSDGSVPELNKLDFKQVRLVMRGTQGKVLTILDATFTDEKRIKYVKDLIKQAFSQQTDWLFELATREFGEFGISTEAEQ